ncbi:hypothetical protein BOX15_Mlig003335g1, partial [Macrostomum lignano]
QVSVRSPRIDSDSFRALLQYLYTGRVEIRLDRLDSLLRLADKTELEELRARLLQRQSGLDGLRAAKPGMRVTTIVLDPDMDQVKRDLAFLANQATPPHLLPEAESDRISCYPDLCLEAESSSEDSVDSPDVASRQFLCHRAFVCGRSDYFRAAVDSELSDADWLADGIRHLRLRCLSFGELASVVAYVYSDQLVISRDDDLDDSSSFAAILALMSAADLLLLPGLKRLCAGRLETRLDCDNVADVLRLSRLMRLPRLEDRCAEYCARHLSEVLPRSDFRLLIMEDAASVRDRQEADTIDIIDQVRSHLPRGARSAQLNQDIDQCLEELGLEA